MCSEVHDVQVKQACACGDPVELAPEFGSKNLLCWAVSRIFRKIHPRPAALVPLGMTCSTGRCSACFGKAYGNMFLPKAEGRESVL